MEERIILYALVLTAELSYLYENINKSYKLVSL